MQITKLVLDNFSSYEGKTVFDFNVKKNQPIILVGGLNGAGKTSIFTAIKIALYGSLAFGYTGNNSFYTKKIRGFINDKAFQTQPFSSGISIEIELEKERETKHYAITRNWQIINSKIEEDYSIYEENRLLEEAERIIFESYILTIIPIELFEFFLFDGEEVGKIFSSDNYSKYLKNALLTMCGIDDLEILQHFCKNYNGRIESEEEKELDNRYKNLLNQIAETDKALSTCETTLANNEQEIATQNILIEQREAEFIRSGGLSPEKVKKLEENEIKYDKKREQIAREIKSFFEDLLPFYIMRDMIPRLRQQINYEEKASIHEYITHMISKEFISSIVSKNVKDSGVSEALYDAIIKKFEVTNGAFDEMIFDLSKTDMGQILHLADTVTMVDTEILTNKIKERDQLVKKITAIRQKLKNSLSAEDAKRYTDEIANAKHRIELLELESVQKQNEKKELESKKQKLNSELSSLKDMIRASTQDRHVLALSNSISQMMDRLINSSMVSIRQQLSQKIIENLRQIYRKENLISIIEISDNFRFDLFQTQMFTINELKSLIANIGSRDFFKLIGQDSTRKLCQFFSLENVDVIEEAIISCNDNNGTIELNKRIDLNTLSKGERQIFILALYWAIIQISGKHIPFVIDTPYARIDASHREEISSKFFPNISSQVIILSTDEEITKEYYRIIKPYISKEYLLQNNQSENKTTVTNGYFF